MAHPYHHSLSSVRTFGGQYSDYVDIHSWFDATKAYYADFRHRALRHHQEGSQWCEKIFGKEIINSDHQRVSVKQIAFQHIEEDCERVVSLRDWLITMSTPRWFDEIKFPNYDKCHRYIFNKFGIQEGETSRLTHLVDFFYHIELDHTRTLWTAVRSNSYGIFEIEKQLGEVILAEGKSIPTRFAAEEVVRFQLRRIPSVQDWLSHIKAEPWMFRTKKITHSV